MITSKAKINVELKLNDTIQATSFEKKSKLILAFELNAMTSPKFTFLWILDHCDFSTKQQRTHMK